MKHKVYLVIHGHFYQPPRENPWTLTIERQASSSPYLNWNEKINEECFSANVDARLLDGYGHIKSIINNYKYINFDIGPTLFSWLAKNDPKTTQEIIDADKKSMDKNNGHGNAIAMAYNHPILPLCNNEDLYTQIKWGLEEFKYRFGRESESIWLPETAVNMRVVEKLIEFGIKYIILAPSQAEKIRHINSNEWIDVSSGSIDISKAYFISGSKGKISVFFYNGPLSAGISFKHFLMNADELKNSILDTVDTSKENQLISMATDGEIYGHHEAFGNMCLAALINNNKKNEDFIISNFANYLELFPPENEVVIKGGKNNLGTSWSCSHGIGRWMENCGCKTGGDLSWTQEWRKPFREALDLLRDNIKPVFEKEAGKYVNDVWEARNDYIFCILDRKKETINSFLKKHSKRKLSEEEISYLIKFMESQKCAMYMYTSCAWFFTEISGIETIQNMKYAKQSIEFIDEFLNGEDIERKTKSMLRKAKSNISDYYDGEWIYNNFALASRITKEQIISQYLFYKILTEQDNSEMYFYKLSIEKISKYEKKEKENIIYSGIVKIFDSIDMTESKYIFYIIHNGEINIHSYLRKYCDSELKNYIDNIVKNNDIFHIKLRFKDWFRSDYTLKDLAIEYKEKILNDIFRKFLKESNGNIIHSLEKSIHSNGDSNLDALLSIAEYYIEYGVDMPLFEKTVLQNLLNNIILKESLILEKNIDNFHFLIIERILKIASSLNINIAKFIIDDMFNIVLNKKIKQLDVNKLDLKLIEILIELVDFANISRLVFKRKEAENKLYYLLKNQIREMINKKYKKYAHIIDRVIELSAKLNINTDEIKLLLNEKVLT